MEGTYISSDVRSHIMPCAKNIPPRVGLKRVCLRRKAWYFTVVVVSILFDVCAVVGWNMEEVWCVVGVTYTLRGRTLFIVSLQSPSFVSSNY